MSEVIQLYNEIALIGCVVELLQLPQSELDRINVNQVAMHFKRIGYLKSIYGIDA